MAILNNNPLVGASGNQGGYNINNSLRFRSSATAYLSRTFSSTGTNNKIQTFSAWVKRGLLSSSANYRLMGGYNGSASFSTEINFVNDNLRVEFGGSVQYELKTTQVFRDPSAWYHIVVAIDTTQATSSNRVKMYVNGSQITAFAIANYPAQNDGSQLTSANANNKLGASWSNAEPFDGYMAEVNFIDGSAKTPSDFGETDTTTGVWKPKAYTGTYGTNGFYLKFSDIATTSGSNAGLGKDFSGNGNYWTTNNISVTSGTTYDAMTDVPTNTSATVANYAVMNPLDKGLVDITGANLNIARTSASASWEHVRGTMQIPSSGKWYAELTFNSGSTDGAILGLCQSSFNLAAQYNGSDASNAYVFATNGYTVNNNTATNQSITFSTGDIINMAFDRDTNKVWFGRNNTWLGSGNPSAGTNETMSSLVADLFPLIGIRSTTTASVNFGQRPFSYTPPTGFVALNTFNLPTPTILQGNKYMDATLYTGTGSSLNVTGVNFQPDFVWIKERVGAADHGLYDAVRGVQKQLESNTTDAETTETTGLTAFNSNGFTVGALAQLNTNTDTYVGWSWKANGAGSSNTSGSITSTVSVNTTAGFSIATFTAPSTNQSFTVGHGLGVAPKMTIVKRRDSSFGASWWVWHIGLGDNTSSYLVLNSTAAAATEPSMWGTVGRTSTVCGFNAPASIITSGTYVLYSFAEIAGFSAFGSATGNGSADGVFCYTGFLPKFILWKKSSDVGDWRVWDTSRSNYNAAQKILYPNGADAEYDPNNGTTNIDVLSNGFKLRSSNLNESAATYIFAAWASSPFKNSNAF